MTCTKCNQPIVKGQPYCKTKRGHHHFQCGVANLPDTAMNPLTQAEIAALKETLPSVITSYEIYRMFAHIEHLQAELARVKQELKDKNEQTDK